MAAVIRNNVHTAGAGPTAMMFAHGFAHPPGDMIAPLEVGDYVHRQMANSKLVVLKATGHCPNLSAPDEVISAIRGFV